MASDVNGRELRVGDKVKALVDYCRTKKGYIYTVSSLEQCEGEYMGAWLENGDYMGRREIEYYTEPKLTPKLIESLDELQVGDYFKDISNTVHEVMEINYSEDYPIETRETVLNLDELISMGAYKVKVEPLEMVEVEEVIEEVKPKLYELVEGRDYVKLEIGDVVKFADGNTHGVHAVDDDNHPYCMYFMGDAWWVEAHYFLPENIISINGVNIHEEYVGDAEITADPYEGWVAGAKVKCIDDTLSYYEEGEVYTLGYNKFGDFGVVDCDRSSHGVVLSEGIIDTFGRETAYADGTAYKHFELIKE